MIALTSHQLARQLLELDDLPVRSDDGPVVVAYEEEGTFGHWIYLETVTLLAYQIAHADDPEEI